MLAAFRKEAPPDRAAGAMEEIEPSRAHPCGADGGRFRPKIFAVCLVIDARQRAIGRAKGPPGVWLFLRNRVLTENPGWRADRGTKGVRKPPRYSLFRGPLYRKD
jgi:hypothetical protein